MQPNIVVVARDPVGTGGGTVAIETAKGLAAIGCDVIILTDYAIPNAPCPNIHSKIGTALRDWRTRTKVTARVRHFLQMIWFGLFCKLQLRRKALAGRIVIDHNIEGFGGEIIVLHNVFIQQFLSDKRGRFKKLVQTGNPVFWLRLAREYVALRSKRTKEVLVVGPDLAQHAAPLLRAGLTPTFIPNGIDTEKFFPFTAEERGAARAVFGLGQEFVVIYIGHEFDRKRLDLAIKALPHVGSDVVLWVIGGRGSSAAAYQKLAEDQGVAERVKFWGTQSDVGAYLRASDCFLLPSDYEAWPLVVLEAMACGLPVIMTPVGCASHVIHEGETGYIVGAQGGDVAREIAERINRISGDRGLLDRMRHQSRAEAEKYAWPKIVERYRDLIVAVSARIGDRGGKGVA